MDSLTLAIDGGEWLASCASCSQGKSPHYLLCRGLGVAEIQSGHSIEEKNSQPPPAIKFQSSNRPAHSQSLYRLSYPSSYSNQIAQV